MTKLKRRIDWKNVFPVFLQICCKKEGKGVSKSRGLALFWKERVTMALNSYSSNHIDVLVGERNDPNRWRFTGVYGFSKVEN